MRLIISVRGERMSIQSLIKEMRAIREEDEAKEKPSYIANQILESIKEFSNLELDKNSSLYIFQKKLELAVVEYTFDCFCTEMLRQREGEE